MLSFNRKKKKSILGKQDNNHPANGSGKAMFSSLGLWKFVHDEN